MEPRRRANGSVCEIFSNLVYFVLKFAKGLFLSFLMRKWLYKKTIHFFYSLHPKKDIVDLSKFGYI
jgi:hypothetical protein